MENMLPHLLRGSVTAVMNVVLLFILTQPKFGRRVTVTAAVTILVLNMVSSFYFYWTGNLTALTKFDLIRLLVIGIVLKPLVRDSFMQWCFNFLTSINFYIIIVILSYRLCYFFPYPWYAVTALRFLMYLAVILLFWRFFRPLYRQVMENWRVFFALIVCIFFNFAYYFFFTNDIEQTLSDEMWPLFLLVALSCAIYVTVLYFLQKISAEYVLNAENLKMQNDKELLYVSASAMAERLQLMDQAAFQNSLAAHDRRHFNSMVLELLEQARIEEATDCLRRQIDMKPPQNKCYCENVPVNAAVCYYAAMAEQSGIRTEFDLAIPNDLAVDSLELAMALSNLIENAIHACDVLADGQNSYIRFTCRHVGRLLLEMTNPCADDVTLDENGHPTAQKAGHGVGTKSVIAFATQYDAELLYHVENGIFRVRLLV